MKSAHGEALRVFGYELVELLGSGGMGRVWRARELDLAREVAIKVLASERLSPRHRQRFLLEARALARIQHPNVVVVYRLGEVGGMPFLAYELIDGLTVDKLIGSLRWPRALGIALDLARGLAAAHTAGVLHRDLKPANAMVTADGTAKLIDFGLAKLLHTDEDEAPGAEEDEEDEDSALRASEVTLPAAGSGGVVDRTLISEPTPDPDDDEGSPARSSASLELTRRGALLGTPRYIAPELWDGAPASPRSDVYTLGLIMWEMLTRRQVHAGAEALEELRLLVGDPLEPVVSLAPEVPASLAALVDRAVGKRPEVRFESAVELCAALEEIADQQRAAGRLDRRGRQRARQLESAESMARAVAVLPFEASGSEDVETLAEGLVAELVENLADTPQLEVRPVSRTLAFAGRRDHVKIGSELGVGLLIEGSVRRMGDRTRVRVRLIDAQQGAALSVRRFDCTLGELFVVSDQVAEAVTEALRERLALAQSGRGRSDPTIADDDEGVQTQSLSDDGWDPRGVELYLEARRELRLRWHSDVSRAIELFEAALERLPGSPRVLAGAAVAYARLAFLGDAEGGERARVALEFAERAIALDPTRSEPHYARAMAHFNTGAPMLAVVALEQALELAPASAEVHDLFGRVLLEIDDLELATKHLDIAHRLSPHEANTRFDLIRAHAFAGDWAKVEGLAQPLTGAEFDDAVLRLTSARVGLWRHAPEQIPVDDSDLGADLVGEITRILRAAGRSESLDPQLVVRLYALEREAAGAPRRRALMNQFLAELSARAGAKAEALAAIERALEVGLADLTWLRRCPLFEVLADEPRYRELCDALEARVRG